MISCKDYVELQKEKIKKEIKENNFKPRLIVVQVDDDNASSTYVKNKKRICDEVGIELTHVCIDSFLASQEQLEYMIKEFGKLNGANGIIIQLPIPDKYDVSKLISCIPAEKDVDGFRKDSCFKPCTPKGIVDWLRYNNFEFVGKTATVIGRSNIVGKPLVNMLIEEGMTVTCCNSHTKDISKYASNTNLVVSAIGKPKYFSRFTFENVDIIVDVGINRDENNKLCGDINTDGFKECLPNTYVTPVPNGVGKLTVCSLIENVLEAYKLQNK